MHISNVTVLPCECLTNGPLPADQDSSNAAPFPYHLQLTEEGLRGALPFTDKFCDVVWNEARVC